MHTINKHCQYSQRSEVYKTTFQMVKGKIFWFKIQKLSKVISSAVQHLIKVILFHYLGKHIIIYE